MSVLPTHHQHTTFPSSKTWTWNYYSSEWMNVIIHLYKLWLQSHWYEALLDLLHTRPVCLLLFVSFFLSLSLSRLLWKESKSEVRSRSGWPFFIESKVETYRHTEWRTSCLISILSNCCVGISSLINESRTWKWTMSSNLWMHLLKDQRWSRRSWSVIESLFALWKNKICWSILIVRYHKMVPWSSSKSRKLKWGYFEVHTHFLFRQRLRSWRDNWSSPLLSTIGRWFIYLTAVL